VPNADPHWTAYLTAFLTPCIAIFVAYIGFQQWRLSRHRLKLDLFDRRWAIYAATNDMLASLINGSDDDRRACAKDFRRRLLDAKFLCSSDTMAFVHRVNQRIFDVVDSERNLRAIDPGAPERKDAEARVANEAKGCKDDCDALVGIFKRELRINF
jgi:hypothetical protein